MKIYLCGGSVRDSIMRQVSRDKDYVVVGATPDEMLSNNYKQVGNDFPVFLDYYGNEYALARTERKTGKGHTGFETMFDSSVTLEEDLKRRDFTFNAMARDLDTGEIIDPFNGQEDIKNGIIRHVSGSFSEDPLRVLRAARFAARFNFMIASETIQLMIKMVKNGELNTLTPERVWNEISRAMMEDHPHLFFKILRDIGAMDIIFGNSSKVFVGIDHRLVELVKSNANEQQRWVGVFYDTSDEIIESFCDKLLVPNKISHAIKFGRDLYQLSSQMNHIDNEYNYKCCIDEILKLCNKYRVWHGENVDLMVNLSFMLIMFVPNIHNNFKTLFIICKEGLLINYDSLTDEEKNTLEGSEIGQRIDEKRKEMIDKWVEINIK